ncbi:hypothetical protein RDI58_026514 [Solanum bulbocastanum]|uniref:Uncharacterized protein n=1 Tax=Solanum bulbocastanum TaxID=147425 RepID=A0AAN8Y3E0_SOLBU
MENLHYSRRQLVASPPQYHPELTMAPSSTLENSHDDSTYVLQVIYNVSIDARVVIVLFCLIETCPKIVKDNTISTNSIVNSQDVASDTISSPPLQEVIVRIEPLQHEGVVHSN